MGEQKMDEVLALLIGMAKRAELSSGRWDALWYLELAGKRIAAGAPQDSDVAQFGELLARDAQRARAEVRY